MVEIPVIEREKCDGCGLCVNVCSLNGLVLVNNVVTFIQTTECNWCALCEAVCGRGAISCPFEIVIEE